MSYRAQSPTPTVSSPAEVMRFRFTVTKRNAQGVVTGSEQGEKEATSAFKLRHELALKHGCPVECVKVELSKPPNPENAMVLQAAKDHTETERFIAECVQQLRALPVDARPIMRVLFIVFDVFGTGTKTYQAFHWCDKATRDEHLQHAVKHEQRANKSTTSGELPVDDDGIVERAHELARRLMAFWLERKSAFSRALENYEKKSEGPNG